MATNGYQYNVGTNVNTSFDTSALNGYRAKQAMKNNWRGSFGSLDSQPAAQASPYSQMGVNNQFQKQGAPVIGESTQPLQAVQNQPVGGKAGAAISGAAGIAGSIVQDANAYNQLVGQDPSKMVDNTYYDPYQTNMRFNQVDNPYTRTTGSYVGENAGKYALQGASVGSAFGPWGALIGGAIGGIGGAIGGAVMGGEVEKKRNEFEASQARARQQFALMQQRNQAAQDKMQRNAQMNDYLTRLYSKRVNFDAL